MNSLDYQRATSLAQARQALADDDQAQLLAGGMTLIPVLKHRLAAPSMLVDIAHLDELRGIRMHGEQLHIGAAMRHAEVAASALVQQTIPSLASLAGDIGDAQVRARGTLGGSVANNDPAADYPAALLALNAVVVTSQREIAAADFFVALFTTALEPGEIITGVRFAVPKRSAYAKFAHPATGYAMAGVYVADLGGGDQRVAITGAVSGVRRWPAAEAAWAQGQTTAVLDSPDLMEDMHAPAAYRAQLATLMFEEALAHLA